MFRNLHQSLGWSFFRQDDFTSWGLLHFFQIQVLTQLQNPERGVVVRVAKKMDCSQGSQRLLISIYYTIGFGFNSTNFEFVRTSFYVNSPI